MQFIYRDKVGNRLKAGNDVYFDPIGGVVEIVSISDPGRKQDGSDKPGIVTMTVRMPFMPQSGEKEKDVHTVAFGFLLKSEDPAKAEEKEEKGAQEYSRVTDIISGVNSKFRGG